MKTGHPEIPFSLVPTTFHTAVSKLTENIFKRIS